MRFRHLGAWLYLIFLLNILPVSSVMAVEDDWRGQARKTIGVTPGQAFPGVFQINERITSAYAEMYLSDPDTFKWAGMAAFASSAVGHGMSLAHETFMAAAQSMGLAAFMLFWPGPNVSMIETRNLLAQGNGLVYDDLYWQHLAYLKRGLPELHKLCQQGDLAGDLCEAWQKINNGKVYKNSELVWKGNLELLYYEQHHTLQRGVYDPNRPLWNKISGFSLFPISSPIPGDPVMFNKFVVGGDLGAFDDRWKWISKSMLPAWKNLDSTSRCNVIMLMKTLARRAQVACNDSGGSVSPVAPTNLRID